MSENTASQIAAPQNAQASRRSILLFPALALMSALLNSSAPTPLYPLYQQQFALSSVSLTVVYGAYAAGVLISLFGVGNLAGKVGFAQRDRAGIAGGVERCAAVCAGGYLCHDAHGATAGRGGHRGIDRGGKHRPGAFWATRRR
ncbi:hypothetical protein M5585_11650 [Serratia ureilytica]